MSKKKVLVIWFFVWMQLKSHKWNRHASVEAGSAALGRGRTSAGAVMAAAMGLLALAGVLRSRAYF